MAGPRLQALRKQFESHKDAIETINRAAESAGRDLTDDERTAQDTAFGEIDRLKPEIETEDAREQSLAALAAVVARHSGTAHTAAGIDRSRPVDQQPATPTPAEYIAGYLAAHAAGTLDDFADRCAPLRIDRANQAIADNLGVVPKPIVGEVIKLIAASRPVFSSLTARPMPAAGKTFSRPRITQGTSVAEQAAEFNALASQKMLLVADDVTKRTFGGQLDISMQDIDWTDPAMLAIVIDDFFDRYALATEAAARTFVGAMPTTVSPWTTTNVGTLVKSFVDGAVKVYNQSSRFPDRIWIDLVSWAMLASTTNTADDVTALTLIRQAFKDTGFPEPKFTVAPGLTTGVTTGTQAVIMAASSLAEQYEQQKGLLRVEAPGTLSQTIAVAGYVAFYGRAEGAVALGTAA